MKIRWPWQKRAAEREAERAHFLSRELHSLRVKLDIIGPTISLLHGRSKAAELVDSAAALLDQAAFEAEKEETALLASPPRPLTEGERFGRIWFEIMNPIAAQSRDPNDEKAMNARRWVSAIVNPEGRKAR